MKSPHETHGITPISHQIHDSHTITTTFISNIQVSCKFSTKQPKSMCYSCNISIVVHRAKNFMHIYIL